MNNREFLQLAEIIINKNLTMEERFKRMRELSPQYKELISKLEETYLRQKEG